MKDIVKMMLGIMVFVIGLFAYLLVTVTVLSYLLHLMHLSAAWLPVVWGGLVFLTGFFACDWTYKRRDRVSETPVPPKFIANADRHIGHKAD